MNTQKKQKGGSVIGHIITLAVLGYGVFFGLQYIPQLIESSSVNSILDSIEANHKASPYLGVDEITGAISKLLNINEINDMKDKFHVKRNAGKYVIEVSYERELNLGYETKILKYEKTLTLR